MKSININQSFLFVEQIWGFPSHYNTPTYDYNNPTNDFTISISSLSRDYRDLEKPARSWTIAKPLPFSPSVIVIMIIIVIIIIVPVDSGRRRAANLSVSFFPSLSISLAGDNIITYTYKKITSYPLRAAPQVPATHTHTHTHTRARAS